VYSFVRGDDLWSRFSLHWLGVDIIGITFVSGLLIIDNQHICGGISVLAGRGLVEPHLVAVVICLLAWALFGWELGVVKRIWHWTFVGLNGPYA
jgi:hypothetical protein